jgi:hypothetical protein
MGLVDPPAHDEIEVTVFGRGVGECVVVHVGNNKWVIIDSYICEHKLQDPRSRRMRRAPIAHWYLDRMNIQPERIGQIVVTHFHRDHYNGVDLLHDHYLKAQLLVTAALDPEVFRQVYADRVTPGLCGKLPETMAQAKRRVSDGGASGLRTLGVGSYMQIDKTRLTALSPMDPAVNASADAIALRMTTGRRDVRKFLRDLNWCSVAMHLHSDAGYALLGADLVNAPPQYGWQAVLAEPNHQSLDAASMVKVPHHGSPNADHIPMWQRLVEDRPQMAVAPYTSSRPTRPSLEDCRRLCDRGALYQAALSIELVTDEFGYDSAAEGPTGIVQARRRPGESQWRIATEGAAFHVNPVLAID